ncbi:hypothetical protein [Streptomyces sp. NPDC003077]|uniref:hypothetical protein n=1 Tax=Streptomyces sp. NPDC003077 TaxID=3154443 RepID=UPI0033B86BDE
MTTSSERYETDVRSKRDEGFVIDGLPEVRRPGVGRVLISEWDVGSPERQREVLAEGTRAWVRTPLPEGFVSRVFYAGTDGRTVLNYGQWTSDAAHEEFVRGEGSGLRARMAAVVGKEVSGPRVFRYYRSLLPQGERPQPGCIVTVRFETTGHEAARRLVDGLLEMMGGVQPGQGSIASHFHISEDGTRVFNYSEWGDVASHERMVESSLRSDGAVMTFIQGLPGVTPLGFKRYVGHQGLVRA